MANETLRQGSLVTLPKGSVIDSYTPSFGRARKRCARSMKVTVHHLTRPHVVLWDDDPKYIPGTVLLGTITWAGSGGYWRTAQITKGVSEANDLTWEIPELSEHQKRYLSLYGVSSDDLSLDLTDEWTLDH